MDKKHSRLSDDCGHPLHKERKGLTEKRPTGMYRQRGTVGEASEDIKPVEAFDPDKGFSDLGGFDATSDY